MKKVPIATTHADRPNLPCMHYVGDTTRVPPETGDNVTCCGTTASTSNMLHQPERGLDIITGGSSWNTPTEQVAVVVLHIMWAHQVSHLCMLGGIWGQGKTYAGRLRIIGNCIPPYVGDRLRPSETMSWFWCDGLAAKLGNISLL